MVIAFLDTETTGLDFKKDKIVEFGFVLYDTDHKVPTYMYGGLTDPGIPMIEEASEVNGITDDMVKGKSLDREIIVEKFLGADYIVAHNAFFDMSFVINEFRDDRNGEEAFNPNKWLDSLLLVDWKRRMPKTKSRRLNYIAADMGIVNPFAHRALTDSLLLLQVITSGDRILEEMISRGECQWAQVRAVRAPFEAKDELRSEGYMAFYGDDGKFKYWYKSVPDVNKNVEAQLHFLSNHVYPKQLTIGYEPLLSEDREKAFERHPADIVFFKRWYNMVAKGVINRG